MPTQQLYTRAGDFSPDANGNLQNGSGNYLLGWALDANGNIPTDRNALTAINIGNLSGKAEASTTMTLQANLQASTAAVASYTPGDMTSGTVTPSFQRTISVYDSQGGSQPLQISYLKTGANTWAYEVSYQGDSANLTAANPSPRHDELQCRRHAGDRRHIGHERRRARSPSPFRGIARPPAFRRRPSPSTWERWEAPTA